MREVKMNVRHHEETACRRGHVPSPKCLARPPALDGDLAVVEFPLLLTVHQVGALEAAAHRAGLTAGQLARLVLGDFLDRESRLSRQVVPRRR